MNFFVSLSNVAFILMVKVLKVMLRAAILVIAFITQEQVIGFKYLKHLLI